MKRVGWMVCYLCVMASLFSACAAPAAIDPEATPYQQYQEAYQQLLEEDSFVVHTELVLTQTEAAGTTVLFPENAFAQAPEETAEKDYRFSFDWQFARKHSGAGQAIGSWWEYDAFGAAEKLADYYYYDGGLYTATGPESLPSSCSPQEEDAAFLAATSGIPLFPQDAVAWKKAAQTAAGLLLQFELDSERYYQYRYPQTYAEQGYPGFSYYREPPFCTVLLYKNGQIQQVTWQYCEVNAEGEAFVRGEAYTIDFRQYGGVKLKFPAQDRAEYPALEEFAGQQ